jgi:hypothetical protein
LSSPPSFDTDESILQLQPPFYFVAGRIASFTTTSFDGLSFQISIDLQEPINLTLKNFVKSKWSNSLSSITANRIKWGTKWWDDYGSLQVHFREASVPERPITIGWQYTYVSHMIDIHIWVRKNIQTMPPELDDIKRSISYIIQTNRTNLPISQPFSNFMRVIRQYDLIENQPLQTLWHSVVQCEVLYWKATTN